MKKYYLSVPYEVLAIKELKLSSKLLLALILSLSQLENGCYASNAFFCRSLGLSERTISTSLTELKQHNYITTKLVNNNRRRIYPCHSKIGNLAPEKPTSPLCKTDKGGYAKPTPNYIEDKKKDSIYNYYNEFDYLDELKPHSSFDIDELEKIV